MIILPTKNRLIKRRKEIYDRLQQVILYAPVSQVEDMMRRIHIINLRLITYFKREKENEKEHSD